MVALQVDLVVMVVHLEWTLAMVALQEDLVVMEVLLVWTLVMEVLQVALVDHQELVGMVHQELVASDHQAMTSVQIHVIVTKNVGELNVLKINATK